MTHIALILALLSAIGMASARADDPYRPLQALHELVDREAAAYRKPIAFVTATCPSSWKTTRPQDIPVQAVETSYQWLGESGFSLRIYRLEGGQMCGVLDLPDRRLLSGEELRQFLEDRDALNTKPFAPPDPTDEPVPTTPLELPPAAKAPTAAELDQKGRAMQLATDARSKWTLPFPKELQQRWMLRSILDARGAELPVPGYDVQLVFREMGFGWYDGCNRSNITLGEEALHTSTLLGCYEYTETDLGLVSRLELEGRILRMHEPIGGLTYVFDPYPHSAISARSDWRLREIRGPLEFDLRTYVDAMQVSLTVIDDRSFSFQDADGTVYKGTLSIADHAIGRMQLDEASSEAARTAVEGQAIYRLYDEATGPFQAAAPDRLIKRIDWRAITEWQVVRGEFRDTRRDLLELRAGTATYVFQ